MDTIIVIAAHRHNPEIAGNIYGPFATWHDATQWAEGQEDADWLMVPDILVAP